VLAAAGRELGETALTVLRLAGDPALLTALPFDPAGVVQVEAGCRRATLGPHGLASTALALELVAATLRAVTTAYRSAEAAACAAVHQVELSAGRATAPLVVPLVLVGLEVAVVLAPVSLVVVKIRTARALTPVPAPLSRTGQSLLGELATRPGLAEHLVASLPGLAGAWLDPVATPGPAGLRDVRQTAALAASALAMVPGMREQPLRVQAAPPRSAPAARGLGHLMATVADCPDRTVRVDAVRDTAGRRAWVVSVPGTSTWSPVPGRDPFDLTSDLRTMGGRDNAARQQVLAAMRVAGVPKDEPVLLVGHSLGGMVAAQVAADPAARNEFRITHLVTAGSPVASSGVPDDVQVLSIEHDHDLVPALDGAANPDRASWVTARTTTPVAPDAGPAGPRPDAPAAPRPDVARQHNAVSAAHVATGYAVTASALDASSDPSLVAYRAGLAPFLAETPDARVTRVDVVGSRG
jgi:pimeloyl-ACP methyl ester carboxylesterase